MSDTRRILLDKLEKIEELHARTDAPGERLAAGQALERLRARLRELEDRDPTREFKFSLHDPYTRSLFIALVRRYGIEPFRYPRQRRQTVVARMPQRFLDETLWPEFEALADTLTDYLGSITRRVIAEDICADTSDASARPELSAELR